MAAIGHPLRPNGLLRSGAAAALTLAPALAVACLLVLRAPAEPSPMLVLAGAAAVAAVAWALVDLEQFALVAVFGAMAFPHALVRPAGALVAAADVLLVLALIVWFVRAAVGRGPAPALVGNPLFAPGVCFATLVVLSLGWSSDRFATAKSAIQIAEIVVVITLVFASLPRSLGAIRRGVTSYVVITSVLAVFGAVTFAGKAMRGDFSPLYVADLHKNALGSFLGVGLVLAFSLSLDRTRSRRFRLWLRAAAVVELVGLTCTISRGAALGAIFAAVTVSLLLRRQRLRTLILVALAAVAFVEVVGRAGAQRAELGGYSSTSVRHLSWADGVDKIREHPLLGTGAGTYWAELEEIDIGLADPNNLFLLTWAELGLPGMAALLFLLWRFGRVGVAARRLPEEARVLALGAAGGALSLLIHFQLDVTWTRGTASICFALMGLVVAARRLGAAPIPAPPSPAQSRPAIRRSSPTAPALRVLHLLSSDGFAGIERHVLRLARGLRAEGTACELACPPSAGRLREAAVSAGIPVLPSQAEPLKGPWLSRLVERLAADPPDIVHVHDGTAAVWGWQLCSRTGARLVRTQHFVRPASLARSGWRRRGSLALHRSLNADVDALVAVSEAVAATLVSRREARLEAVTVIPPGIELPSDAAYAAATATRSGLQNPVVAYLGRFEAEKDLPLLLDAIPGVLERLPACRFVLAGSGSLERELHARAHDLGIENAVEWPGRVEPEAVLARAHVFVNPTPAEAFGLATAEAMAYGLPVVASASGASVELVDDGVTGLLVPRAEPARLAGAIARLAGDRGLAARMGEAARARAVARFGVEQTVARTLDLYRRLVVR